jgi:hypothetical protein
MSKPLSTAELQIIITRWDDGAGVTEAVKAFAQDVPVAERTVRYWIAGRRIHQAMAERIRSVKPPKKAEPFLALRLCQKCGRGKNSRHHLRECDWI